MTEILEDIVARRLRVTGIYGNEIDVLNYLAKDYTINVKSETGRDNFFKIIQSKELIEIDQFHFTKEKNKDVLKLHLSSNVDGKPLVCFCDIYLFED